MFQKLVTENYGYRMYLDDMPSGVALGKRDALYEENIPVGYFPYVSRESYDGLHIETAVFNHLDLKVIISPAWLTSASISSESEK